MKYAYAASLVVAFGLVPFAFAEENAPAGPVAAPAPALAPASAAGADACRVATLPVRQAWVERQVTIPARTVEDCLPVFETAKVPVFEERRVPEYRDVQVPITATREVPCFEERSVPRYGPVEVPVYAEVSRPVGFSIWNPFDCDDRCLDIHLWDTCDRVQCGTEIRQGIVGHDTERVQVGTRTETYVSGFETRRELVGERCETVQVGERDEQRQVGWRNETRVIEPARTETVRECVWLPAEPVTVAPSPETAKVAAPLPGTTRVISEDEYRREVAVAR
jgi:hypothetical protein